MPGTKQKDPQVLTHQAGHKEITSVNSISQASQVISFTFEPNASVEEKLGIDSFNGRVAAFKLYLLAQRLLLEAGVIMP
ncbi:MAG: hypothetical protein ACYDEJ_03400 [Desulfitobacteriaceae bacterium]